MKRYVIPLLVLVVAAASAVVVFTATTASARRGEEEACGTERWAFKTLSDRQRNFVNLHPRPTTVAKINALQPPTRFSGRRTPYERQVWRVTAQITRYKIEHDRDIHLILLDHGANMIAEMPARICLPRRTRDRRALILVRRMFESRCGPVPHSWHDLGAVVEISGVGFWDVPHNQPGHALNNAELHPVTGLRIISGCS